MSPQQALELLVNAARQARLTYADHAAADQAAKVLLAALAPPENNEEGRKGGKKPRATEA